MNCEHCKLPREAWHDCMVSLMAEVAQLRDALNQAKERAYAEYGRLCEAVRPEPQSAEHGDKHE